MEFCSMLYGSLDGRGVWERTDTCIWMVETLHSCSTETITTLLVNHLYSKIKGYKKERSLGYHLKQNSEEWLLNILQNPRIYQFWRRKLISWTDMGKLPWYRKQMLQTTVPLWSRSRHLKEDLGKIHIRPLGCGRGRFVHWSCILQIFPDLSIYLSLSVSRDSLLSFR